MSENIRAKAVKGAGWSLTDSVLSQGITFLVGLVLANLLSPEEYGMIGIMMILVALSNSIVDSGFSSALIRKSDVKDEDYNTVFITNMALSCILSLLMFLCAPVIASFFRQPMLIPLTKVMSFIIIINALAIIQRTILVKDVNFRTQAKVSVIASIGSGMVGVGMAVIDCGVWSLVGQQFSKQLLNTSLLWMWAKWYPKFHFSIRSFKELFGFGWKLLVAGLIDTMWKEIYKIVIGKCYSTETLGQYTRAHQFAAIFSSNLTSIVQRVSYPVLSKIQDDSERLKAGYKKIIKVTMLIAFTCMMVLAAIAKPMVITLIGEQWLQSVPFLQIICFQMMLYPLHSINLNMLQIQGRSDLFLKLEIIKKMVAICPLILGIFIDIYWMLGSSVLVGVISYYLNASYSGRLLDYSIGEQLKDIIPSFCIASAVAMVTFLVGLVSLSPPVVLSVQILTALVFFITICEVTRIDAYIELRNISLSYISKHKWKTRR